MLILSRKSGQAIMIGDKVVVRVVEVRGNQVSIGVEAPRDVIVDREEVWERRSEGLKERKA